MINKKDRKLEEKFKVNNKVEMNNIVYDIESLDKIKFRKCTHCHGLMLPINFKIEITKEVKHKFIDLYEDIPQETESLYTDENGVMCKNCLNRWQSSR